MKKRFFSILLAGLMVFTSVPIPSMAAPASETAEIHFQPELKTRYTRPAQMSVNGEPLAEALPIGNGYMGAMVYGGVDSDRILINEKTVWSGGPGSDENYNGGMPRGKTTEENLANLETARRELQDTMTAFSADESNKPVYDEASGKWIGKDYPTNQTAVNAINQLKGDKNHFGSYQALANLYIEDVGLTGPKIVRIFANNEHKNGQNGGEGSGNLFDGNTGSKYFADPPNGTSYTVPYIVEWDYNKAFLANSYSLTTGNDMPSRDPKSWVLYASEEAEGEDSYVQVSEVIDFKEDSRGKTVKFDLDAPGTYQRYRLVVNDLRDNTQKFQLAEIEVSAGEKEKVQFSNYERTLSLDDSKVNISYTRDGVDYEKEYFVNYPSNMMAIRVSASESGKLTTHVRLSSPQGMKTISSEGDTITMTGWPSDQIHGSEEDFSNALHFAQQVKVIPQGGSVRAEEDGLTIEGADSAVILMTAGTNYNLSMTEKYDDFFTGEDPLLAVKERMQTAVEKGYDQLLEEHERDYHELFDRVQLNLDGLSAPAEKTTDELLNGYAKTNTPEEDRYLETLYYQFGRYLLISSSREGSLPANLQGVWADGLNPPWNSDYHANINLQMNYWPAQQTNLEETHKPLIEYIKSLAVKGYAGAKTIFGNDTRGWTIWHENNIWGGVGPATSDAFFSPEDGAWIANDLWEYYQFTKDEAFLRENYKTLKDAALFWVDNLVTDERDGSLVVSPSYSPEHGAYSLGATEPQAVVWGIFDQVLQASEIVGDTEADIQEIREAQKNLSSPKIGQAGQFQEWKDEIQMDITGDGGHRHVNHLYPLHPGNQIVIGRSAEEDAFGEAMKVTLNTRGDGGTGWSKAWKINFWARLRDGDRAQKLVKELLSESTLPNLFDTHAPFQIDGNFGGTSGMTEMLLQSQGGAIELLPALPAKWNSGRVTGLKARGNVEIDMQWDEKELKTAKLRPQVDGDLTVKAENLTTGVLTKNGEAAAFETIEGDKDSIIIKDAKAGDVYSLSEIQPSGESVDAYSELSAVKADVINGSLTVGESAVEDTARGDYLLFKNVAFGEEGAKSVILKASAGTKNPSQAGAVEVRLDSKNGELLASVGLADMGTDYLRFFENFAGKVTGKHNVYLVFTGNANLESLQFFGEEQTPGEVTSTKLVGNSPIYINASKNESYAYHMAVAYADGLVRVGGIASEWTLSGNYAGVKLNDGFLGIKANSAAQKFTITATAENGALSASKDVELINGTVSSIKLRAIDRDDESAGSNPSGQMQIGSNLAEFLKPGGWLKYENVDLKDGIQGGRTYFASPAIRDKRRLEVRVAEPGQGDVDSATTVAIFDIKGETGGWQTLKECGNPVISNGEASKGIKDVYIYWSDSEFNYSNTELDLLTANEAPEQSEISVEVQPRDAEIELLDADGYGYTAQNGGQTMLPNGTYTYRVTNGTVEDTGTFDIPGKTALYVDLNGQIAGLAAEAAKEAAEVAEQAKTDAEEAQRLAQIAQNAADTAKAEAEAAAESAGTDSAAAEQARIAAEQAQAKADDAKKLAETARDAASQSAQAAKDAEDAAKKAQAGAEGALQEAKQARDAALQAQQTAEQSKNDASQSAKSAEGYANQAEAAKDLAVAAAETAKEAADVAGQAKKDAQEAEKLAKAAQEAADKAKDQAEAAAQTAGTNSAAAEQAKIAATEAQEKADAAKKLAEDAKDAADQSAKAAKDAENAAKEARTGAEEALQKVEQARDAASKAQQSAEESKTAASKSAESAEKYANLAEAAKDLAVAAKDEALKAQAAAEAAQKVSEEKAKAAEQAQKIAEEKAKEAEKAIERAEQLKKEMEDLLAQAKFEKAKVSIKSAKSARKKQVKLSWKKVESAEGYQIQYALKANFKGKKTVTVNSAKAAGKVITKLKSGKKYYFRMRAYKTISNKKVYTVYSAKKIVKKVK